MHVTVLAQISLVRNCFRRLLPKSLPVQLPLSPFARIFRMRILLVGAGVQPNRAVAVLGRRGVLRAGQVVVGDDPADQGECDDSGIGGRQRLAFPMPRF